MFWSPTRLNHASPTVDEMPAPTAGDRVASDRVDASQLELAFRQWIVARARPEFLLLEPDGGEATSVSVEDALLRLRASTRPLGSRPADRLGLPAEATVGAAAAALLDARLDPKGPRCRSFRSAALYLVGLAELQLDHHDAGSSRGTADVA